MDTIDLVEFRNTGYLQEANRRFFHPLGLALTVWLPADGEPGEPCLVVQDFRHVDNEGTFFGDLSDNESILKAQQVADLAQRTALQRNAAMQRDFGVSAVSHDLLLVQPINTKVNNHPHTPGAAEKPDTPETAVTDSGCLSLSGSSFGGLGGSNG